jgi:hypothetical protein
MSEMKMDGPINLGRKNDQEIEIVGEIKTRKGNKNVPPKRPKHQNDAQENMVKCLQSAKTVPPATPARRATTAPAFKTVKPNWGLESDLKADPVAVEAVEVVEVGKIGRGLLVVTAGVATGVVTVVLLVQWR